MTKFFNDFPEFITKINMTHSNSKALMNAKVNLARLNKRHELFFSHWNNIWEGKSVLDIAGYDGRWSFAALKAGASKATIVEVRKSNVDQGIETFKKLNVPSSSYEFINQDFLDWKPTTKFDVVLCAGFLSHVYDHPKVFSIIRQCDPEFLVIDSGVNFYAGNIVEVWKNVNREGNSHLSDLSFVENDGQDLIANWSGLPSRGYLLDLAKTYDFDLVEEYDWQSNIDQEETLGLEDYWIKRRISTLWKRTEGWRWDRKPFNK